MKGTQIAVVMAVFAGGLVQPDRVRAAEMSELAGGPAAGATPVYRNIDRATGAEVRVLRNASGETTVEVVSSDVTVQKRLAAGRTLTRIVTGLEDLTVALDGRGFVAVTDHRLGLTAHGTTADELRQARNRLRGSPAVHAAANLLGRMDLAAASPVNATLRGSHLLMASAVSMATPVSRVARAVSQIPAGAGLAGAMQDQDDRMTANDCWTEYTIEAIAAWTEYEQCVDAEEWWDLPGMLACLALYDMRALGAFSVWAACVSLRG